MLRVVTAPPTPKAAQEAPLESTSGSTQRRPSPAGRGASAVMALRLQAAELEACMRPQSASQGRDEDAVQDPTSTASASCKLETSANEVAPEDASSERQGSPKTHEAIEESEVVDPQQEDAAEADKTETESLEDEVAPCEASVASPASSPALCASTALAESNDAKTDNVENRGHKLSAGADVADLARRIENLDPAWREALVGLVAAAESGAPPPAQSGRHCAAASGDDTSAAVVLCAVCGKAAAAAPPC
eukprot:TRINITY_DN20037_c0_g1_i2.p1 TRINITY_DN20037_c0_g1~~TRINITY_DN20037_c0_g1_i2.p1  ORF type:complete len:249 (-),score=55.04 TRINITY_DN20037_c0_g1_i2:21-767(-)